MTPLLHDIIRLIRLEGPLSLERYMSMALGDPRYGYYMSRDPFGAQGDFTTAPEISQIFGELIGLWCADLWLRMDSPPAISLVELGPGRGTLMQDALRAMKNIAGLHAALRVTLVETSPLLRDSQRKTLSKAGVPIEWHGDVSNLPQLPTFLIANEFFDALPIRQYQTVKGRWHERLIGVNDRDELVFGLSTEGENRVMTGAPEASIIERCGIGDGIMSEIAIHVRQFGGAGLIIDYGHTRSGWGDTLQAMKAHRFVDPLEDPGEADLTSHVDFENLAKIAKHRGTQICGPVTQGAFLESLGLRERGKALLNSSNPEQSTAIIAAIERLTDPAPKQMGSLFKVLGFRHSETPIPAGFL